MPGQAQAAPDVRVTLLGRFAVSVGGVPVAEAGWKRRHAAAVVKVLALAPGRRLHREQVIDLIWPDDTIAAAIPKLHKAAHYARRAIGVPDAVVLRGDQVLLCPGVTVTVDAVEFGELARRALDGTSLGTGPGASTGASTETRTALARRALALYAGELLPGDRYEEWAEPRRDQLRRQHLELLRLDGRWEAVAELDPADEQAHLALMRRQAANGERHAALRQFDRLDRALRQELGIAPGPEATALRDRLLAAQQVFPRRDGPLLGRDLELAIAGQALRDASAGQGQTLIVTGPAGQGKSSLLEAITARAAELGMACGHGTSAAVEGAWPYAPVIEALGGLGRDDPALLSGMAAGSSSTGPGPAYRPAGSGRARTSASSRPPRNWSARSRPPGACCSPSTTCTRPTMPACGCSTTSPGPRAGSGCASCSRTVRRRCRTPWPSCVPA
jgi:DNA-binding SARP family transcriptional activator